MKIVAAALFICALGSCTPHSVNDLAWLEGKWEGVSDDVSIFEEWTRDGESLNGSGGAIADADTVFLEQISIITRDNQLFYRAATPENNEPVDFVFTGSSGDSFRFENSTHDFPQRIIYFRNGADSLYARIEGKQNGESAFQEFRFKRTR